jgi:hypothetical protein
MFLTLRLVSPSVNVHDIALWFPKNEEAIKQIDPNSSVDFLSSKHFKAVIAAGNAFFYQLPLGYIAFILRMDCSGNDSSMRRMDNCNVNRNFGRNVNHTLVRYLL